MARGEDAGQDVRQLGLPVARDPRDAENLPGVDLEGDAFQSGQALLVEGGQVLDFEQGGTTTLRLAPFHPEGLSADHHAGQLDPGGFALGDSADDPSVPEHGDSVGDRHHLVKLV